MPSMINGRKLLHFYPKHLKTTFNTGSGSAQEKNKTIKNWPLPSSDPRLVAAPMVTGPRSAQTGHYLRGGEASGAVTEPEHHDDGQMSDVGQCLNNVLRSTPPCPDGEKPRTCADGSEPRRLRGGTRGERRENRRGGRRCSREEKICCDGSTPSFDQDRSTPPCADGNRPK